ncbi:MAG TPA: AMP-binding protein [Pseudonocardiaceae bacterium]|nr:AMP-binding protein [Pseudonocardiaceae bacterium]
MSSSGGYEPLIHRAVAAQATLRPEATALVHRDDHIAYQTLEAAATSYAAELTELGVGVGQVVPLLLPRSPQLVAVQLAVLKCGAAYANLDRRWPADRIAGILELTSPILVAAEGVLPPGRRTVYRPPAEDVRAAAARAGALPPTEVSGSDPATVFFTSGTTGRPKGVVSPHQAVTRLFGPGRLPGFGTGHATPQAAPQPWDMYAFELWGQLTTGGTTVLVEADHLLPSSLRGLVRTAGVDTLWITTSLFNLFVDEDPDCFAGLGHVLVGGEKLSPQHVRSFLHRHPGIPLRNGYGPVENCMLTTTHVLRTEDCDLPGGLPVGRAVPDSTVLVLDPDDRPCPANEPGEICVAGTGLATRYLGDAELTAEKFPVLELGGAPLRIYRTGDIGLVDDNGVLHFRGRRDRQVKISGYRVEMAEIEVTVGGLPGVRDCVALPLTDSEGRVHRLALFYLTDLDGREESAGVDDPLRIRDQLLDLLPGYAVPTIVRGLDRLPITANGKLDRRALVELARKSRASRPAKATRVANRTQARP